MHNKTVIVILTVAAVLVGFIFIFERGSMTTSEKLARKGRVFAAFKEDAVTRLEVTQKGRPKVVIERDMIKKELDENVWHITAPRKVKADDLEVQQLLSAIDFLLMDRAVVGKDKITDPSFGVDDPAVVGAFTIGGKTTTFRIGAEARGDKVYLQSSSAEDTVYAVNKSFLDSFDKGLNDLRDKHLVTDEIEAVDRVAVKRAETPIDIKKRADDEWQVKVDDTWVLAAGDQVRELISAVQHLEAETFVADDVKKAGLAQYGLDAPSVTLEIAATGAEAQDKDSAKKAGGEKQAPDAKMVAVALGKPCPGEEKRQYATVAGSGVVACVSEDFSKIAARPVARFQETRPAVFGVSDVTAVTLEAGGKSLALKKEEEAWQIPADAEMAVDSDAVDQLIKSVTDTRASRIDVGEAAVTALGNQQGRAVFTLADDMGEVTLQWFDGETDTEAKLRREGEPAVLVVPRVLADSLVPNRLAFRSKHIENAHAHDATKIRIQGAAAQTLEKRDGKWSLVTPTEIAADDMGARRVTELVAEIKTDGFVAEKALPEHGFAKPYATVTVTFESLEEDGDDDKAEAEAKTTKKDVTLELGAATETGKRYARVKGGDPVVFTVGDDYENAVSKPLVARDLLQIDDVNIKTISFTTTTPEKKIELVKSAGTWKRADDGAFNADTLNRLVADLGGLKTVSTAAFGNTDPSFGDTVLTIVATQGTNGKNEFKTLKIGAKSPNETEDGYFARTQDLDVTFVIPARIVDDLLAFVGATS